MLPKINKLPFLLRQTSVATVVNISTAKMTRNIDVKSNQCFLRHTVVMNATCSFNTLPVDIFVREPTRLENVRGEMVGGGDPLGFQQRLPVTCKKEDFRNILCCLFDS